MSPQKPMFFGRNAIVKYKMIYFAYSKLLNRQSSVLQFKMELSISMTA